MNPPKNSRKSKRHPVQKLTVLASLVISTAICAGEELPEVKLEKLVAIPASKFTKVIDAATSPDKRLAVALGSPDGSEPKWEEVANENGKSFMLEDDKCRNYLIDLKKDRVTGILDGSHFGTRSSYNHESASYAWSPDGHWLVEIQSWKWNTAVCSVHRVGVEGSLEGRFDFTKTADQVVVRRLLEMKVKVPDKENTGYATTLSDPQITNDGKLTANLSSEIPKDPDSEYVSVKVTATISRSEGGTMSAKVTKVTPVE
jgi:hypothetical protein